jgi:hypothetical protein
MLRAQCGDQSGSTRRAFGQPGDRAGIQDQHRTVPPQVARWAGRAAIHRARTSARAVLRGGLTDLSKQPVQVGISFGE